MPLDAVEGNVFFVGEGFALALIFHVIDVVVRVTVEEVSLLVNFGFTSLLGAKPTFLVDEEAE